MSDLLFRLLLFAIPASAASWRGLGWRALICAGIVLAGFLLATGGRLSLQVESGDANIGAGIVIHFALITLVNGLLARTVSLMAEGFGHPRPWSLWIEAAFFLGFPWALDLWIAGGGP